MWIVRDGPVDRQPLRRDAKTVLAQHFGLVDAHFADAIQIWSPSASKPSAHAEEALRVVNNWTPSAPSSPTRKSISPSDGSTSPSGSAAANPANRICA
jgi:hypothetical protein